MEFLFHHLLQMDYWSYQLVES